MLFSPNDELHVIANEMSVATTMTREMHRPHVIISSSVARHTSSGAAQNWTQRYAAVLSLRRGHVSVLLVTGQYVQLLG